MEDRLSAPLPLLPLDTETASLVSSQSSNGPWTTPRGHRDETEQVIAWQAAEILNQINIDVLIHKVPKLAGQDNEIQRVPVVKSYMNVLLLLQEKDTDKQWITRIPYNQSDRDFLVEQVEPLIRVNKKFKFRVPYLYHYGLAKDPNNELGVDFLLLDFIDGSQMKMWTESFPAWEQKLQVLEQIADVYIEMFSKPVTYQDRLVLKNDNNIEGMQQDFDGFELPPTMTASLWYHRLADKAIRGKIERLLAPDAQERAAELHTTLEARLQDLLTLLLMRALIPRMIVSQYNDSPFFITHPDLHNRNIILEGRQVEDDNIPAVTTRMRFSTGEHSVVNTRPRHVLHDCNPSMPIIVGPQRDKLKLTGIVDWDAAHPLPLQAAAILPKFLETLPGAEFPDLPPKYKAPDLTSEKNTFADILRGKERERTGCTNVSDLIKHGSWERDFFTVSFRRGDVRARWWQWWKAQQAKVRSSDEYVQNELYLEDLRIMHSGLRGFLSKEENFVVIQRCNGWALILRVLHELQKWEDLAIESCWISPSRQSFVRRSRSADSIVTTSSDSTEDRYFMPGSFPRTPSHVSLSEEVCRLPDADDNKGSIVEPHEEDNVSDHREVERDMVDDLSGLLYTHHCKNPIGG